MAPPGNPPASAPPAGLLPASAPPAGYLRASAPPAGHHRASSLRAGKFLAGDSPHPLYPDLGPDKQATSLAGCGAALVTWDGTTAYSNGVNTGTAASCLGGGQYGWEYQCVELVMRHFLSKWSLNWDGDATDLLDNAPLGKVDVYSDGDAAHPPVPGDMIVFGGGEMGHVALVTEVTGTEVTIIEQNVPSSFERKLQRSGGHVDLGWDGWWTKGWAHAKANGAGGGGGSEPSDPGGGDPPSDPPGGPNPGDEPLSNPPGWSCADSAYNGHQYWTCAGGDLYRCFGGKPMKVDCPKGCITRPPGQNDACH